MLFEHPVQRIAAWTGEELSEAFLALEEQRRRGFHACGYLAYEAGYFMGDGHFECPPPLARGLPLLDFFTFETFRPMTGPEVADWLLHAAGSDESVTIHDVALTETIETYRRKIEAIKESILDGNTYQANFTFKYRFRFEGSTIALYRKLRERQRVEFGAYMELPEYEILSFSPELFVRKQGESVTSIPMKGTAPRGLSSEEDARLVARLRSDPKTLSENVMIVDLVRNDLGRVARLGSVRVENLFEVQTFEAVHQMVSTVHASVDREISLRDFLLAVFPCGSITGAPKTRTMEIIQNLETEPRGLYTGALGFVAPTNDFCFSVPIRTLVTRGKTGEMGVGSGIVHESDPAEEYDECLLKASFLTGLNSSFALIETFRFNGATGQAHGLAAHLDRLQASAKYFHFTFDRFRTLEAIERATLRRREGEYKVRITVASNGEVTVAMEAITKVAPGPSGVRPIATSERRIDSSSCFQRHKTTMRPLYDEEYSFWRARGAYDVVFLNERGGVAEASRHNIFVEKEGRLITPPLSAGALPGIERRRVLDDPKWDASEGCVSMRDLRSANRIFLTNAVRGVVDVKLSWVPAGEVESHPNARECST
jgi:para-aminobenzoate synthetase/4-amino-4-deoxychorismate lyase